ncbi:MAG: hypothetical protein JWL76_97 [Thermoleophilia bacterium]|nr:hypothetical protein [Thermoleophilia bacterium]
MRRLLPTALAVAVLVGAFSGVASARLAGDGHPAPKAAPFHAPAVVPREDADHAGTYGFRTSAAIAAKLTGAEAPAAAAATSGGASATVTITATVLPVVTIVVDHGSVVELVTNTPERDARGVLYVVRTDTSSGPTVALDAKTWASARTALAAAHVGTGTIWSA